MKKAIDPSSDLGQTHVIFLDKNHPQFGFALDYSMQISVKINLGNGFLPNLGAQKKGRFLVLLP